MVLYHPDTVVVDQMPQFQENKDNIWEQGTKKNNFATFWGTGKRGNLFQGNKGTGTLRAMM